MKLSKKQFIEVMTATAIEAGFDDPENAFWQCNVFSQAVLQVAVDYNVKDVSLILVEAEYQDSVGDVEAGSIHKHVIVKIKDTYYDWTIKQVDPEAEFPFKSKKLPKYFKSLGVVYSEDVLKGFEYYPNMIKKLKK